MRVEKLRATLLDAKRLAAHRMQVAAAALPGQTAVAQVSEGAPGRLITERSRQLDSGVATGVHADAKHQADRIRKDTERGAKGGVGKVASGATGIRMNGTAAPPRPRCQPSRPRCETAQSFGTSLLPTAFNDW